MAESNFGWRSPQFMLEIRHFESLLALSADGHYGRASKRIGISQPTLTRDIQALERHVGETLFDRNHGGAHPTRYGEIVISRARELVSIVERLHGELDASQQTDAGLLRVGADPGSATLLMAPAVASLAKSHPKLAPRVVVESWLELRERLDSGHLDVVILPIGWQENASSVETIPLGKRRIVIFCRPGHPLAERKSVRPEEAFAYRLMSGPRPRGVDRSLRASIPAGAPDPIEECLSYSFMKEFVCGSDTIAGAMINLVDDDLRSGDVVELHVEDLKLHVEPRVVRRSGHELTPIEQLYIDSVLAQDERTRAEHPDWYFDG